MKFSIFILTMVMVCSISLLQAQQIPQSTSQSTASGITKSEQVVNVAPSTSETRKNTSAGIDAPPQAEENSAVEGNQVRQNTAAFLEKKQNSPIQEKEEK